jgi:hypothetical protein
MNKNYQNFDRKKLLESKLKKVIKPIVERMLREEDNDDDFKIHGEQLAEKSGGSGEYINKIYFAALTEANYHEFRKKVEPIINRYFASAQKG